MAAGLSNTQIVGVGLLGAAAYFYFNPQAFASLLESSGLSSDQADRIADQIGLPETPRRTARRMNMATALASGASAGSVAGPIGAGIGAAAAGIGYAIAELGLFRGGWEGVKGNTIRDRFIDQFVQAYFPGAGIEQQYEAMVKALAAIGIVGDNEPGASNPSAGTMIRMLYNADSADEMRQAISSWAGLFKARANITLIVPPEEAY